MKTVAVRGGPGVAGVAGTSGVPVGRRVRRSRRRRMLGAWLGIAAALLLPALAAAHPLGNFTINHYTGIRVETDRILLDVVIDQAEIPAFAARLDFDTDGDGEVSDAETDIGRGTACQKLAPTLTLAVDGKPQVLTLTVAGLRFPPGVGGLSTMRLICGYQATLAAPLAAGSLVTYADTSFTDRLGWREIVVSGSGVTLTGKDGAELRTTTTSARLTLYPTNLLTQALQDKSVAIVATPGGPTLPALDIPDAAPLTGAVVAGASASPAVSGAGAGAGPVATAAPVIAPAVAGTVPGGVTSGDLPDIFRSADLSPVVFIVSILTAAVLGAGHALTPGHGKTLMAAYLVGTKGTPLHAAGLGLSVTLSHTIGILVLAGLVVGAQGFLPPDLVVKILPIIAAFSIVAIGGWMVFSEGRRRWLVRAAAHEHGETLSHAVPAAHEHGVAEGHQADHGHAHEAAGAHVHPYEPGVAAAHEHPHPHESAVAAAHAHPHPHPHVPAPGEHNHGGVTHTHLPPAGAAITWRSLFVLGLAGGLIPSASALLILLGSIAAGRPAFGFVLVVAFGLGMAFVMSGIGLALVLARGRLDKVDSASSLGRASRYLPLVASFLVFGLGLYLTFQAVAGNTTF